MKCAENKNKLIVVRSFTVFFVLLAITAAESSGVMRNISSMEIVRDMLVGWNLGNTLDSWDDKESGETGLEIETSWGNPKTTKEMFDAVKARGFKTIRIPVTWRGHFGNSPDFIIDSEWLDRVEEVVNYALDGKTYVIINSHHDEWVTLTEATKTEVSEKICKIWAQIAERFKEYGDYLLFETLNEPRLYGTQYEWTGGTASARSILNEYNHAIVSAIRATGGNNTLRHILIPTHAAASYAETQDALVIPENDTRIIVSQHIYFPYYFTMDTSPQTATDQWGSAADKEAMIDEFDRLEQKFISKGIPVVIGEWGSINKSNLAVRVEHAKFYTTEAKKRGICAIWWDNNLPVPGEQTFGLLDRESCTWSHPEIADAIIQAAGGTSVQWDYRRKAYFDGQQMVPGINEIIHGRPFQLSVFDLKGKLIFQNAVRPTGTSVPLRIPENIATGSYIIGIRTTGTQITSNNVIVR